MTATLFDLESTPTRKRRHTPDPMPCLTETPRYGTCPKCGQTILESQPPISDVVTVAPHTLTPAAVQAALHLGIRVYRAPITNTWLPEKLWATHIADLPHFKHWEWYWLPEHVCRAPTLPGYAIQARPRNTTPTTGTPPY